MHRKLLEHCLDGARLLVIVEQMDKLADRCTSDTSYVDRADDVMSVPRQSMRPDPPLAPFLAGHLSSASLMPLRPSPRLARRPSYAPPRTPCEPMEALSLTMARSSSAKIVICEVAVDDGSWRTLG